MTWIARVWGRPLLPLIVEGYQPGGCRLERARQGKHGPHTARGSPRVRLCLLRATADLVRVTAEEVAEAYGNRYFAVLK